MYVVVDVAKLEEKLVSTEFELHRLKQQQLQHESTDGLSRQQDGDSVGVGDSVGEVSDWSQHKDVISQQVNNTVHLFNNILT